MEVGDRVDELGARVGLQRGFDSIGVHALRIHRDGDVGRLTGVERDQPAEERRILGDDPVALVDEQLGDEVEPLLAAVQDQDVVVRALHTLVGHATGDLRSQVRTAVRHRVLQCVPAVLDDRSSEHVFELLEREQGRVGVATAERDDRRVGTELQEVAYRRRFDLLHSGCISSGHHILQ